MTDLVLLHAVHLCIRPAASFFRGEYGIPAELVLSGSWDDVSLRVAFKEEGFGAWASRVGESADGCGTGGVEAL